MGSPFQKAQPSIQFCTLGKWDWGFLIDGFEITGDCYLKSFDKIRSNFYVNFRVVAFTIWIYALDPRTITLPPLVNLLQFIRATSHPLIRVELRFLLLFIMGINVRALVFLLSPDFYVSSPNIITANVSGVNFWAWNPWRKSLSWSSFLFKGSYFSSWSYLYHSTSMPRNSSSFISMGSDRTKIGIPMHPWGLDTSIL